jgi:alginate O-acetyltransferase complex protein AlgI
MPFNSVIFIFIFAPVVIGLSLLFRSFANRIILTASAMFYAWGEPKFVGVVIVSAMLDYLLAAGIARTPNVSIQKLLLTTGIAANLTLLVYCKYAAFFVETLGALFGASSLPIMQILLPLGISFIVFEKITYLVDVYRRTTSPAQSIFDYLFFVFFFPKMLAGPIIQYHDIRAQIEQRSVSLDDVEAGATRFLLGLAKKVLIADTMAPLVDKLFSAPVAQLGFADAWLGAVCFTVQIYFDFSGYSDMAIGLSRVLGFRLKENFNQPYLAIGFSDFWQRWHISLSSWIRDYLYIPLGGNHGSRLRVTLNLWICFLASGLWHGASWTFVFWGAYHGLFVSLDRIARERAWPRLPSLVGIAATFFLVLIGWVLFRATTISQAFAFLGAMADPTRVSGLPDLWVTTDVYILLAVGFVLSFLPLQQVRRWTASLSEPLVRATQHVFLWAATAWSLGHVYTSSFQPFIYFRF